MDGADRWGGGSGVQAEIDRRGLAGGAGDALVVVADIKTVFARVRPEADGGGDDEGLVGWCRIFKHCHRAGYERTGCAQRVEDNGDRHIGKAAYVAAIELAGDTAIGKSLVK